MIEHSTHEPTSQTEIATRRKSSALRWALVAVVVVALVVIFFASRKPAQERSDAGGAGTAQGKGAGAGRKGGPGGAGGPIPVVGVKAQKGDIGVVLTGLGSVTPIYTVTVKTRVDGELTKVQYKEGQYVKKGQLLAEVDPRPYQVQLIQAEGQLAKDQAALDNARIDLKRYEDLAPHNAIPEQQVATQRALVQQYEGAVKSDQGPIAAAKLNLQYCEIRAPFDGRVGLRLVDPGNIVHASDSNGLLVITQVQPISVVFTLPEDQVRAVLQRMNQGARLNVSALDRDQRRVIAQGVLSSVDNQIDPTTGTLKLRANFDNKKFELFPSQFVNVQLLVEEKHGVTLINSAAIQRNSTNTYVYLVKPDSSVTVRNIAVGTSQDNRTEIASGLNPGDTVVMTGVDKLQEGSKVNVHIQGAGQKDGE